MIIKARSDRTIYQTECKVNPDIDFKELMDALESKQFKFVSKTPETLNLKVGVLKLDFKNFENMPGIELSEKVDTLSNRLNEQLERNNQLQNGIQILRREMDQTITRMGNLERKVTEQQSQINQLEEDKVQQVNKIRSIEKELNLHGTKINEKNALIKSLTSDV
jgi:hypothetical protein